jgi:formate/nitrite transporter FocA (FNT family)
MKRIGKVLVLGILAGLFIGLGGFAFVACVAYGGEAGKIYGSLAFSVGLFMVCFFGANLYTGKIGFAFENRSWSNALDLFVMLIGNAIGSIGLGYLVYGAVVNLGSQDLLNTAVKISANRCILTPQGGCENWYSSLLLAVLCGMLVFLAVKLYKDGPNFGVKILGLVMCVFTFVVSGTEHCIADMFYFSMGNSWSLGSFLNILLGILGNSLGAWLVWGLFALSKREIEQKKC